MGFFGAVSGRAVQSQNFGTECWKTISGSPKLCLRIGFNSKNDVFRLCGVFWWLGLFLAQSGSGKVN